MPAKAVEFFRGTASPGASAPNALAEALLRTLGTKKGGPDWTWPAALLTPFSDCSEERRVFTVLVGRRLQHSPGARKAPVMHFALKPDGLPVWFSRKGHPTRERTFTL